ncbi:MAG: hypothetical protein PSV46_21700 [Reyranella sp.]|nr:hypothetical protein [Reyranella sp.]
MPSDDSLTALEGFTIRRVANTGVKVRILRPEDLRRLVELGFVMINDGRAMLTEIGHRHFDELQRTADRNRKPDLP